MGPGAIHHGHITLGRPPKTLIGAHWGSLGLIGAHLGLWRAFLDVNQSLGRVKSSDLVQNGRNTSPGVVGAL